MPHQDLRALLEARVPGGACFSLPFRSIAGCSLRVIDDNDFQRTSVQLICSIQKSERNQQGGEDNPACLPNGNEPDQPSG